MFLTLQSFRSGSRSMTRQSILESVRDHRANVKFMTPKEGMLSLAPWFAKKDPSFAQFAYQTMEQARKLNRPDVVEKLQNAWEAVGITPSATTPPPSFENP